MQHEVMDLKGKKVKTISLKPNVFNVDFNPILLKEIIEFQQRNARQATYGTCSRGELSYSTKKIRKQKGSGRSRAGPFGAPQYRHGGVAFGPDGRIYAMTMPKQKKRKALAMCLSQKLRDKDVIFVDSLFLPKAKTKDFVGLCESLKLDSGTLFVDAERQDSFFLSMRNVIGYHFLPICGLNSFSLVKAKKIVMTESAVQALEEKYESL